MIYLWIFSHELFRNENRMKLYDQRSLSTLNAYNLWPNSYSKIIHEYGLAFLWNDSGLLWERLRPGFFMQ